MSTQVTRTKPEIHTQMKSGLYQCTSAVYPDLKNALIGNPPPNILLSKLWLTSVEEVVFLLQGLLKEPPSPEVWPVEHHLALQRVERVVDEMREAR